MGRVMIYHPTDKILIDASLFETIVVGLVFPSRYGQKEEIYSGPIRVNYFGGKICYIDRMELTSDYKRPLDEKEIPKEFIEWFETMNANGKVYKNFID